MLGRSEALRGLCPARPLQNSHFQPPLLPGGHSHQSSARETLSSGAPPVDSASAAGCSAPRSSGLGCWRLTSVCWQRLSTPSSEETEVRPCPPLWSPVTVGSQRPQGPTRIRVRSRPHVQNPVAPEVLAAPPSPSPTAIPLPLFHVWPQVGTALHPGQEAPPMEIPPARLHSALKPPSPCPHQRVTLPETSSFHSQARGCAHGAAGSSQDQSLCYCSRRSECGLDPRLGLSKGCPRTAQAGRGQPAA